MPRPSFTAAARVAILGAMTTTYRAVMLTKKGGPEVLETIELPVPEPGPGEVRVRVLASGVGYTDVLMRRGYYPYAPPIPFVPGYEVVGEVEALGSGVTGLTRGQRVAALVVHGGYGEVLVRGADKFVPVPAGLDPAEVVALILNYVTAYQMIHRTAAMKAGQTALVTGANGGVGTALLELLRAHGVRALGAASSRHHEVVRSLGATPIEGRAAPIDQGALAVIPGGVDVSFDGLGDVYLGQCVRATRRGGQVISYGFTGTVRGGVSSNLGAMRGMLALHLGGRLRGRRPAFYGITQLYRKDPGPFREDLPRLFALLRDGAIRPRIAARLPLLDARRGNEQIEAGGVDGKIVLVAGTA